MITQRSYPAKIMLFGEYAVLVGSSALSLPFPRYTASLSFPGEVNGSPTEDQKRSNHQLALFGRYLLAHGKYFGALMDLDQLQTDISRGLYLRSTIPQHSGLGSSGALCAAILGGYGTDDMPTAINGQASGVLDIFRRMESFFHGSSSGMDPMVSYMQHALLSSPYHPIKEVTIPSSLKHPDSILLFDSGEPSRTETLVGWFLKVHTRGNSLTPSAMRYVALTNQCIKCILSGDVDAFRTGLQALSALQYKELTPMIPSPVRPIWKAGLTTGAYSMKLCGSGGGGVFLCFHHTNADAGSLTRDSRFQSIDADSPELPEKESPDLVANVKYKTSQHV